jgi:hypothetical protein
MKKIDESLKVVTVFSTGCASLALRRRPHPALNAIRHPEA